MTLKELQQSIDSSGEAAPPGVSVAAEPALSLKELQQKAGILLYRDGDEEACEKKPLAEIQQQTSQRHISDPEEIRTIFQNTLLRPLNSIPFADSSLGSYFKTIQDDNTSGASVAMNDITLLDVLTMCQWSGTHIGDCTFAKRIGRELLEAASDIWFAGLLRISINALGEYPYFITDAESQRELFRKIGSCYRDVFNKLIGSSVTIGWTLSRLNDRLNKSWRINTDIGEYQKEMLRCCRLIESIIDLIVAGHTANVEARVSENIYPFKYLTELLQRCEDYIQKAGTPGITQRRK
ncbi:MAG: hypothetical protein J1F11_06395 [Oscillospiraceae bacterium]|nr:hypothetical protein [Oscillospiraceae bacterium]